MKNKNAVALGRRGGKSTSPAKQATARENGRKGGKPPKIHTLKVPCPKEGCRIGLQTDTNILIHELRTTGVLAGAGTEAFCRELLS
jgi:hypothetical protein